VPFNDQPSPNPDYFAVRVKGNHTYRIETIVTPGVDTVIYLYPPGATDDAQYIASNDNASGLGFGSRITWTPRIGGFYIIRVLNRALLPHESYETYGLLVSEIYLFRVFLPIVVKNPTWR
jgi:hypothetical protein